MDVDLETIALLLLKMEEVLWLLIRLIDVPSLYHELLNSRMHGTLFSRILTQISQVGSNCPSGLISFLSNQLLAKVCRSSG